MAARTQKFSRRGGGEERCVVVGVGDGGMDSCKMHGGDGIHTKGEKKIQKKGLLACACVAPLDRAAKCVSAISEFSENLMNHGCHPSLASTHRHTLIVTHTEGNPAGNGDLSVVSQIRCVLMTEVLGVRCGPKFAVRGDVGFDLHQNFTKGHGF